MKKIALMTILFISAAGICFADNNMLVNSQIDNLEVQTYGSTRTGSLLSRLENVEKDLYGTKLEGSLAERLAAHVDYVDKGTNEQPSLMFKLSVAEWSLDIQNNAALWLTERVPVLEKRLDGSAMADKPIAMRVERLVNMVVSDSINIAPVTVPAGTVARLQLMQTLRPSVTKKGESVLFRLTHNIIVGNKLIATVGSPAIATVTSVKKPRSFGRPSEIKVKITALVSMGNSSIPVTEGKASKEATEFEASYAAAAGTSLVGAVAFGPLGLAGGFFIRGNAKDVPAGSVMYVETERDAVVPAYVVPPALSSKIADNKYVQVTLPKEDTLPNAAEQKKEVPAPVKRKRETEADSL